MSDLRAIADLYAEVDDFLEALRDKAVADIADACRSTIRHAQTHGNWRDRRAWTLYNPDDRRLSGLSFENRLTLVLERGSKNWKEVLHYSVRNQIAHRLRSQRIDVSSVIDGFYPIQASLADNLNPHDRHRRR